MTQNQSLVIPEAIEGEIKFPETASEEAPPQEPQTPAPEQAQEAPETPIEAPEQEDFSDEAIWQRAVASDPELRSVYMQQRYGQSAPAPQMQPQQPQMPPQQPEFDLEELDITDGRQVAALLQHVVQQQNKPLLDYVQHLQQQDQYQQQELERQRTAQMEQEIHRTVDQFLPGFSEFAGKDATTLSDSEFAVREYAASQFTKEMQKFPREAWASVRLQKEVTKKIGPKVKAFASAAGLNKSGTDPVSAGEMHVQPSAARPSQAGGANLGNLFEQAYGKGDKTAQVKYTNALFDAMNQKNFR